MACRQPTCSTTGTGSSTTSSPATLPMRSSCASIPATIFNASSRTMPSTPRTVRSVTTSRSRVGPSISSPGSTSTRSSAATLQRALLSIGTRPSLQPSQGPKNWWTDPEVAARAAGTPAVRRSRSLFQAIDEECRRHGHQAVHPGRGPGRQLSGEERGEPPGAHPGELGTRYPRDRRRDQGASPARLISPSPSPIDGHLNEAGHAYIAQEAAPSLEAFLAGTGPTARP